MANNLSLSNVINVTLIPSISGLSEFNTANLLLYSTENPIEDFGNDAYRVYYTASSVAEDFGVNSLTYKMANAVFAQAPNILSNSGALIIALKDGNETQAEAFYRLKAKVLFCGWITTDSILNDVNANKSSWIKPASIAATVTADSVEDIKAIASPTLSIATNISDESSSASIDFTTVEFDFSNANSIDEIVGIIKDGLIEALGEEWNAYQDSGKITIESFSQDVDNIAIGDNSLSEALKLDSASSPNSEEREGFSGITDAIQTETNKINFVVSNQETDLESFNDNITLRDNTKTRCLFYGGTEEDAKIMMAAYASKAMSTIFEASLTTQTMHLKPLTGVSPDPIMDETLLLKCKNYGVDSYVSIEGVACVFSTGKNGFFDEVFNELWFVNAIQVAGFNYLRQTNTKIPQTEGGMDGLKNAYAQVCVRGINNGFLAAGSWTSPDTFGNPDLFKRNIETNGYYVYSQPVAQQNKSDREERKAPLVQIAIKTAGAIHSTNVMIYVNL